jgi:hypothetical protein
MALARGSRIAVRVLLFAACLHLARPAHADETALRAASERFRQGVEAVNRGELANAAREFEAAYALSPNPVVLYNLGQTQSALGRPVEAVRSLRRYLESSPPPNAERAREAEALIRANERTIGVLELELVPSSARLEVDAVPATLEAGKLRLAAGRHVLVAELDGYLPGVMNVDIAGESATAARLELRPVLAAAASAAAPPLQRAEPDTARVLAEPPAGPSPAGLSTTSIAALAGVGLGVVALGLGTIYAVKASTLDSAARSTGHCDAQTCDDTGLPLRESAQRHSNVATGLFIAGGALVAAGLTVHFVWGTGAEPKRAQ